MGAMEPVMSLGALVGLTGLCAACWGVLSLSVVNACRHHPYEYASRIVSLVHAIASIIICGAVLWMNFEQGCCGPARANELFALVFSAGYFTADLIGMAVTDTFDAVYALHHAAALLGIGGPLVMHTSAYVAVLTIFLLELSNPPMHSHWLLHYLTDPNERATSKQIARMRSLFAAMFFLARIALAPFTLHTVLTKPTCWWLHGLLGIGFQSFNVFFFVRLLITLCDPEKKIEMRW